MILKSCTRKIASCPLYLQSESMAKLGVPTMVRATTIAPLAQYISMLKWWHLQNSLKSSMVDFYNHSLSKIPMRRIVPFLVFKKKLTAGSETNSVWSSPQVDCELSSSCQGLPKHLVASSKKKIELYKTPSQWQKILRPEYASKVPCVKLVSSLMIYGNTEGNQLWFYLFLNCSQSIHGSSAGSKVEGNCGVQQDLRVLDTQIKGTIKTLESFEPS